MNLCLPSAEKDFFAVPTETISTRKRERSQLEWIARGEQFLNCTRLSMRLQNSKGHDVSMASHIVFKHKPLQMEEIAQWEIIVVSISHSHPFCFQFPSASRTKYSARRVIKVVSIFHERNV